MILNILNTACLTIWIFVLVLTIAETKNKRTVSPVTTICALVVCITHYLSEIVKQI